MSTSGLPIPGVRCSHMLGLILNFLVKENTTLVSAGLSPLTALQHNCPERADLGFSLTLRKFEGVH